MTIANYTPTVTELAQLIPSRAATRFTGGGSTPAFPDETRVQAVINDAVGLVAPTLGGDGLDEQFYAGAKAVIKLRAALTLEPSAWPEQGRPDKSSFEQWMQLYESDLANLTEAIKRFRDDGDDGPGAAQPVLGAFPPPGLLRPCPEDW